MLYSDIMLMFSAKSLYYMICTGHLVMSCNSVVFVELLDFLLTELAKNANISTTRTYIQCLGGITYVATLLSIFLVHV